MNMADRPSSITTPQELQEFWRQMLQDAFERYQTANARYRVLLREEPAAQVRHPGIALGLARDAESEALAEYMQILKIFTELTLQGRFDKFGLRQLADEETVNVDLISVVDDDKSVRDSTGSLLRAAGYRVATFASAELFLESDAFSRTRCLILDIRMPDMDGLELQRRMHTWAADVPIIFVTSHGNKSNRQEAFAAGASGFFPKPFLASAFLAAVQTAIDKPLRSRVQTCRS
jgi:two-component system, LuxR family, response regulator FixJ